MFWWKVYNSLVAELVENVKFKDIQAGESFKLYVLSPSLQCLKSLSILFKYFYRSQLFVR